jgi:hypothetical protein
MKSLAGKIEETRKEYGNSFNYIVSTISKRQYVLQKNTVIFLGIKSISFTKATNFTL